MNRSLLVMALALLQLPSVAASPESAQPIETFVPPQAIDFKTPTFPLAQRRKNEDGWAIVNFMVDPDGRAYDATVAESSAPPFGREALKSVRASLYEPATFNGRKIDASNVMRITFELSGKPGAKPQFIRARKRLHKAFEKGDAAQIEKHLAKLEEHTSNLYESAFLSLARYRLLAAGDDERAKLRALAHATYMDKSRGFLPDDVLTSMLMARLQHELKLNYIGFARRTIAALDARELDAEQSGSVRRLERIVDDYVARDEPFGQNHIIGARDRVHIALERSAFSIDDADGDVAELRVHCSRGYRGFIHRPGTLYRLQDDYGECTLHVIGTPGTKFTLNEHPTKATAAAPVDAAVSGCARS